MLILGQKSCILVPTIFKFHTRTDINVYAFILTDRPKLQSSKYDVLYISNKKQLEEGKIGDNFLRVSEGEYLEWINKISKQFFDIWNS